VRRSSPEAVLPNGIRIEFLGSAVGRTEFSTAKSWHRTARRFLPVALTGWIPPTAAGSCGGMSNSVTFYFRVRDPGALGFAPWAGYLAEDDTGFRYERGGSLCSHGGATNMVYGLIVPAYPRRQADFKFNFYDSSGGVLATLRVANPVRGPFPEWRPAPLPQTKKSNSVSLTLESLHEAGSAQWPRVDPKWKVNTSDPAWSSAAALFAMFSDVTGNEGQHLSPRENAWKVRGIVRRDNAAVFSANEQLTITNIAIPAAANFVGIDQSAECAGVKLKALVVAGPGRFLLTNGVGRGMSRAISTGTSTSTYGTNVTQSWGGPEHFLLVQAIDVLPDDEMVFRLRDDQGRVCKLPTSGEYTIDNTGLRTYKRNFTPASDAKSLTLEIIVNRPVIFEFMVNPADVLPAKSRNPIL
jgi:hypothetical protein